jgi:hypothetical protein
MSLISLADYKTKKGITGEEDDVKNQLFLDQASAFIEKYCDRTFASTTYTDEEYDGTQTQTLILKQWPVTSVTSVQYRDDIYSDSDFSTLDSQYYFRDEDPGTIRRIDGVFEEGIHNWRVTYVAGYATIPDDLQEACADIATFMENTVKAKGIDSETLSQYSVNYSKDKKKIIDGAGIRDILDLYKKEQMEAV